MNGQYSEDALLNAFQAGGSEMEAAIRYLYSNKDWNSAASIHVMKHGGTKADRAMVLNDALLIVAMNVHKGKYKGDSNLKTYFSGICRNVWFSMLRKKKQDITSSSTPPSDEQAAYYVETDFMKNEQQELLGEILDTLGEDCKTVLGMWALNYSFKEIAERMHISEGAARKRKYDCLKKLSTLLKERPWLVEEILND